MAQLREYNGRYCESEYEYAFIGFLETEGWIYSSGNNISRTTKRDVLIAADFKKFIADTNPDLMEDEVTQIFDNVRLVGSESDFATLHKVYSWMVDGVQFTPQYGLVKMIPLIDFENWDKNIFRVVNQFTVEYTNNGQKQNRRPDVLLFVNGIPLCVIELKNPADANATIYDAWEQINIRYWRDIPHLLHYCPLACISDGVKTRLGTVRTPYEHFYAWRRVNDGDKVSILPFAETETMIKGVYAPERFLEIFRDYIYFQDSIYDSSEVEIVCRYPQFFAARLLKQSIVNSVATKSGKGGTYFGATGCGKTYTMAFLARQLALRCTDIPESGSPTIILIVDREELQKQGAKLFTKSKEFLNLGEVSVVKNRAQLRQELGARQSGGFYICTIQKFCDREDDKIGLINERQNIICFSDEAHRTQLEHSKKIQFSKDADENMKAMVSKPYAKVLKEAFPQATFVGFTGTPIAETYQTFGDEIDRYTMDQAVADGLTVSIKYHPRIAKVLLDNNKVKEIEKYYKKCADDGATYEDIEASKKAMSSMEVILGEPSRLERLATDIHDHYVSACAGDPDRVQKAMVVCSNRKIAYALLQKFKDKYPEWFEEKKTQDGVSVTEEELKELKPMPFIAMVSSVGSNDEKGMYNYLGGVKNDKRSDELDIAFKQEKSNLHMVIVVDMWITGFDVPCLTYLYNDKPLKKHMLIQTMEESMKTIDTNTFVNSFKVKPDKSMSFLLGAGASISSNIPSGGQMVWDFKRTLYCTANNIRTSLYGDLSKENVQKEIQSYFDGQGGYPELWSTEEYSFYFEKCYPSRKDREYYIQNKVRDIKPSLGYLCMGEMIINGKVDLVSTTNFDDLVQAGVHSIDSGISIKTISSAVSNSVGFSLNEGFPNIIKLHGDYLFDKLKNTELELQKLEDEIADIWKKSIKENGLIVIGYAGNDNSVMSVLEELISEGGIKKGVYWCKPKGSNLSIRACKFMETACNVNEQSAVVEIEAFDDLMYSLYLAMNLENSSIDELWKGHDKKQDILYDAIGKHTATVITNALPAMQFPRKCYVFSSSITTWKELRATTNNSCVAILYKGKVWTLGSKSGILEAFADKNISNIEEMDIPIYMMKLEHSDVIGMFYEIIANNLLSMGLSSFGKNKYFDKNSGRLKNGCFVYDAIKIALSFVDSNVA